MSDDRPALDVHANDAAPCACGYPGDMPDRPALDREARIEAATVALYDDLYGDGAWDQQDAGTKGVYLRAMTRALSEVPQEGT